MAEAEAEDVDHHRHLEQPHRPELPPGQPPPAAEQQAPAAPGGERQEHVGDQADGDDDPHHGEQGVAVVALEHVAGRGTQRRREPDQQRRPHRARPQQPEREGARRIAQDAGGDVGGKARAGDEAGEQQRPRSRAARTTPSRARPPPATPARGAAGAPGRRGRGCARPGRGGGRRRRCRPGRRRRRPGSEAAARGEDAGGDAGEVLADQGGQGEEGAEAEGARRRRRREEVGDGAGAGHGSARPASSGIPRRRCPGRGGAVAARSSGGGYPAGLALRSCRAQWRRVDGATPKSGSTSTPWRARIMAIRA